MIKELIDEIDRAMESLQSLRLKLRLMQTEEQTSMPALINHAHGSARFHDHPEGEAYGLAHSRSHDSSLQEV